MPHGSDYPMLFGGLLAALKKKRGGIRPEAMGNIWRVIAAKRVIKYAINSINSLL